jgi:hypothetical protein
VHRVDLLHPDRGPPGHHVAEGGNKTAVELDGEDARAGFRERDRKRAEPGADLQDSVARAHAGVRNDRTREVRVGQEVLAERLRRSDPVTSGEGANG